MIKTALALTAIAMALGVFANSRTEHWWLATLMGLFGISALVLLGILLWRDQQESNG